MTAPGPALRPTRPADAPALAHIHVTGWRETYAGLMPPDFLDRMTNDAARQRREANWLHTVSDGAETVWVAERAGQAVAFASAAPARDHPGYEAELMTLYALRAARGYGLGRALLGAVARDLRTRGFQKLALWVLDVNPTRDWYLRQGGREAGEKTVPIPGGELREVRVVWDDLTQLS